MANSSTVIQFLVSIVPILVLIYLMAKKNGLPSYKALPLIALVILLIQLFYWGNTASTIAASVIASLVSTLVPVTIIFGAILFNRFIEISGAIIVIKRWLANVTPNPTAQLMIIGWAFAFMIEGASGFGTPAAIAAPLLVSLGFRAIPVCILTLVMNSVPVSFGAVGTPTWYGFSQIVSSLSTDSANFFVIIGQKTALIHVIASLIVPVIALRFVVSWGEIRKNLLFIYASIIVCVLPYWIIAQVNDEFPSLVGGAIGLLLSVLIAKTGFGISSDIKYEDCQMDQDTKKIMEKESTSNVVRALTPFGILIGILIVTRIKQIPLKGWLNDQTPLFNLNLGFSDFTLTRSLTFKFTHILNTGVGDAYKLLYVPALIPFVVTVLFCAFMWKINGKKVGGIFKSSLSSVKLTYVALFGAFVMVKLMKLGNAELHIESMVTVIGDKFSEFFGNNWVYFASYLGAIGAFFSGSNTVSNLTFGNIQQQIAISSGVNQTTMLALQSVGGAMGNMVCLNNIIAVCTVTGVLSKEGYIIKRTSIPMFVYGIVAGICAYVFMTIWPATWAASDAVQKATSAVAYLLNIA